MEDASTDDSSDELCSSYATFAKRTYEDAVKRAAKVIPKKDSLLDSSSDSEKDKPIKKKSKEKEGGKEKNVRNVRSKKKAGLSSKSSSKKEEDESIALSSDSDYLDTLIEKDCTSPISRHLRSSIREVYALDDELDYDTDPEQQNVKDTVTLSDSSDIEIIQSPELKNRRCKVVNEIMSIKICWKLQPIQKFQLRRHQKFKSLLEHFAKLEGVPVEQVVIYGGKDSLRSIEPYDTPDTIGITVTDVLEGGILSKGSSKHSTVAKRYRDPSEADSEEIELRVQQEQTRSFPLLINKHQQMKVLFIKVAEQLEVDVDKVKLLLDGEVINPDSTPLDLDLDNDDVLDMVML